MNTVYSCFIGDLITLYNNNFSLLTRIRKRLDAEKLYIDNDININYKNCPSSSLLDIVKNLKWLEMRLIPELDLLSLGIIRQNLKVAGMMQKKFGNLWVEL